MKKKFDVSAFSGYISHLIDAGVAELADARDSKSRSPWGVWVQVPPPAFLFFPTNAIYRISELFPTYSATWAYVENK